MAEEMTLRGEGAAMSPEDLERLDRAYFMHPSTHLKAHARGDTPERVIIGGDGIHIVDNKGRRSIDGFAGLYCVNIGYGRREVADAIAGQAGKLAYYHAYSGHASEPAIRLSEKIIERAPAGMSRVYYGLSGSDANETQIKLIWYFNNILGRPDKKKIISRRRGYHGSTVMAGSLTGLPLFHKAFDLPRSPILHTQCPHYWKYADAEMSEHEYSKKCAEELEAMILQEGPETVAAFIGEPVMGTGGIIPPPEHYWAEIQKVLRKHDILLIADEVITAFGRIGAWFGSEIYGMTPDLITVAKGLTSGYLPLSGVLVSDKVWCVLEQGADKMGPLGHGWTYSAHPLCAAAGMANLEILEREEIIDHVREIGPYFLTRLQEVLTESPIVGEVRGEGLLAAVEFAGGAQRRTPFDPSLAVGTRIAAACAESGLIVRAMPHGDILGMAPPLILRESEADQMVDIIGASVQKIADQLKRSGSIG